MVDKIITITEEDFYTKFTRINNHIDKNASFDGKMFETYGEELEYVKSQAPLNKVWTIIECDGEEEDEETRPNMYFTTGMHHVNRIGYFVTTEPYKCEMEVKLDW